MLKDIKNSFDFFLRNKIGISRKNFSETNQKLIERNTLENQYTKDVLEQLDDQFIQRNLSPGGCADLLAITYFMHFLCS